MDSLSICTCEKFELDSRIICACEKFELDSRIICAFEKFELDSRLRRPFWPLGGIFICLDCFLLISKHWFFKMYRSKQKNMLLGGMCACIR